MTYQIHVAPHLTKISPRVNPNGYLLKSSEKSPVAVHCLPDGQVVASQQVVDEILSRRRSFSEYRVTGKGMQESLQVQRVQCRPLLPRVRPLPDNYSYTPLGQNLHVPDEKDLAFVPYIGDDIHPDKEKEIFSDFEVKERENRLNLGAPHLINRKRKLIEETIRYLGVDARALTNKDLTLIASKLALWTGLPVEIIHEHLRESSSCSSVNSRRTGESIKAESTSLTAVGSERTLPVVEEPEEDSSADYGTDSAYLKSFSSYHELYCAVCYKYDCNIHGVLEKPSPSSQFQSALRKDMSTLDPPLPAPTVITGLDSKAQLTLTQKRFCAWLLRIFDGQIDKVAKCIRAPEQSVASFVAEQGLAVSTKPPLHAGDKKGSQSRYYSLRNYGDIIKVLDSMASKRVFPLFQPCIHEGPCVKGECSCIDNNLFCVAACSGGSECPNFFRGCCCQGGCSGRMLCSCLSMGRECDPSLCLCGTCSDPPNQPILRQLHPDSVTGQICRNDNISMKRGVPLLVAKSEISGWGCFNKFSLTKGDYVGEYVGEVISLSEAERRGSIADVQGKTYIFGICCDADIDAKRKGNEVRFMNHSPEPNCRPDILFANGIQRVGIWAATCIAPQTELTIDYGTLFEKAEGGQTSAKRLKIDDSN